MHKPLWHAIALVVLASSASAEVFFTNKDWAVTCDNTGTCRAEGYATESAAFTTDMVSVLLTRQAGPGTPITGQVMLSIDYETGVQIAPESDLDLVIDGVFVASFAQDPDDAGAVALPQNATDALVNALAGSTDIDFVTGSHTRHLSNAGSASVFLKMDDVQGRIGDPDAMIRRGTKTPSTAAPAQNAPQIEPAEVQGNRPGDGALFDALKPLVTNALATPEFLERCNEFRRRVDEGDDVLTLTRLNIDYFKVSAPCWLGAYNAGAAVFTAAFGAPTDLMLVSDAVSYDGGNEVVVWHKSRGLGDCWWGATYIWTGTQFAKTFEGSTGMCRGFLGGAWRLPRFVSTSQ